MTILADI